MSASRKERNARERSKREMSKFKGVTGGNALALAEADTTDRDGDRDDGSQGEHNATDERHAEDSKRRKGENGLWSLSRRPFNLTPARPLHRR